MKEIERQKVLRFANDELMKEAVYNLIVRAFKKNKYTDMHMNAAKALALDYLDTAWNEIGRAAAESDSVTSDLKQVGM